MKKIIFGFLFLFSILNMKAQPGSIDTSFHVGTGFQLTAAFNKGIKSFAIQPDKKILVAGTFAAYNGTVFKQLIRLNPDGSIDSTFNIGTTGFLGEISSIHANADTTVLVAGSFTYLNTTSVTHIVKLDKFGNIDGSFNTNLTINGGINAMEVDALTGNIYIGGGFTTIAGNPYKHIARLLPNGDLDVTFSVGSGFTGTFGSSPVFSLLIQADNKLLVGGDFLFYKNVLAPKLCRININGDIDTAFVSNLSSGFDNIIYAIEQMTSGKIIVGGEFSVFQGSTYNKLVCLNPDGSLDPGFNIGAGIGGTIYTIKKTPDNKILVGGSFNTFNNAFDRSFIQLNPNGSRDANFYTGTGLLLTSNAPSVFAIYVQADSNIIVGGFFDKYQDSTRNNIIRVIGKGVSQIPVLELSTKSAALITNNSTRLGGVIISDGNSPINEQGVCWSTNQNPSIFNCINIAYDQTINEDFTVFAYDLQDTTRYYARAFAINGIDTAYGDQITFITRSNENYTCGEVAFTYNGTPVTYGTVKGKYGRCWMDRNLGANKIAESTTDEQSYGGFYQWGRNTDGHQVVTSGTVQTLSPNTNPTHSDFITVQTAPFDWTSNPNDDLWNGLNAVNNPCPTGWRIPTTDEFVEEMTLWTNLNNFGAFESALRLPSGGVRGYLSGSRQNVGSWASYWTSEAFTSANANVKMLNVESTQAQIVNTYKAIGANVRCIKDYTVGMEESKLQNSTFSIYPNPANSSITLNYSGNLNEKTTISICNYLGQEMMQSNLQSNTTTINVSDFSNGIYFVKIQTNKTQEVQRLVIQK